MKYEWGLWSERQENERPLLDYYRSARRPVKLKDLRILPLRSVACPYRALDLQPAQSEERLLLWSWPEKDEFSRLLVTDVALDGLYAWLRRQADLPPHNPSPGGVRPLLEQVRRQSGRAQARELWRRTVAAALRGCVPPASLLFPVTTEDEATERECEGRERERRKHDLVRGSWCGVGDGPRLLLAGEVALDAARERLREAKRAHPELRFYSRRPMGTRATPEAELTLEWWR